MIRPPFPGPMRMPMRGPPPLSIGVRPMMDGQPPPMGFPGGHPGVIPPHPMSLQQQPRMEVRTYETLPLMLVIRIDLH